MGQFPIRTITKSSVVLTAENIRLYISSPLSRSLNESVLHAIMNPKQGKLIMTSEDQFKAGGEHGKPWVEANQWIAE
jgi:hypothetical protein